MSEKTSLWTRVVRVLRPQRETYETRRARGAEIGADATPQYNQATDQRRHGGSGAIGSP